MLVECFLGFSDVFFFDFLRFFLWVFVGFSWVFCLLFGCFLFIFCFTITQLLRTYLDDFF